MLEGCLLPQGNTALLYACKSKDGDDMVSFLLSKGADATVCNHQVWCCVDLKQVSAGLTSSCNPDPIIFYPARLGQHDLHFALYTAAQCLFGICHLAGIALEDLLVQGCTAMMYKCESHTDSDYRVCDVLDSLVCSGSDVNAQDVEVCLGLSASVMSSQLLLVHCLHWRTITLTLCHLCLTGQYCTGARLYAWA